ncbi:unnamed protein product [Microthlaspi erraticum]|uniref:Pectinesterase inhibitor domain-containing protein n=1 Tax=Microthlaspi erraticum TaxID=1685480 RepID=A0A6D2J8A4_9BRAS|nr:unnamed protein product [Microthlaspi erraticum]
MSIAPQMAVLATIFLLAAAWIQSAAALGISIADPCYVAQFPVLCRGTIKGQTNVYAATDVAIRELMRRTRHAKDIAKKEMKPIGGVSTCMSNFNSAFDNLDTALSNIKDNDSFGLNINLSAALTDYDTCKDAMQGARETHSVVYKSAGVLFQMADNCLALSTLVKPI